MTSTVPGHKKSQSMINQKIANLFFKGAKTTKPVQNQSFIVQTKTGPDPEISRSIDRMMNSYIVKPSAPDDEDGFRVHHQRTATQVQDTSLLSKLDVRDRTSMEMPPKKALNSGRPLSNQGAPYNVAQKNIKNRADKISSSGKVVASSAAVKKPTTAQSKLSGPSPVQQPASHHRVKSDTLHSKKAKELIGQIERTAI